MSNMIEERIQLGGYILFMITLQLEKKGAQIQEREGWTVAEVSGT